MKRNNIRKFRELFGITQAELSRLSGVSYCHLRLLELRGSSTKISTAYKIANALEQTVYDIWPDDTKGEHLHHTKGEHLASKEETEKAQHT